MKRIPIVRPLGALALMTAAAIQTAPAATGVEPDSFSGNCSASAVVIPYSQFDGVGTCSGTLNGKAITNAPVTIHATAAGLTLPVLPILQKGTGHLDFDGTATRIDFSFDQVVAALNIKGAAGGSATGLAIPIPKLPGQTQSTAQLVALTVTPLRG